MVNTKECSKCGETKMITKFGIERKRKDGYQRWCNDCRNSYQYANTDAKLYEIINPIGERYIGVTQTTLNKRFSRYNYNLKNGKTKTPRLLINSFIQFGLENHPINLIQNLGKISRDEMFRIEKDYIKTHQPELNIQHK